MKEPNSKSTSRSAVTSKIRLSNTLDELQAREGNLPRSQIRSAVVEADVDAEPVWSVIPRRIVRELGLATRQTWIGRQAFGVKFKIHGRTTSESALIGGRKVLIGRTVLMGTDLVIDVPRARVVANPKNPDGPVFRV